MIDAVGPGVVGWKPGSGSASAGTAATAATATTAAAGEFFACVTGQVTGVTFDGGYAEYMIAPASRSR